MLKIFLVLFSVLVKLEVAIEENLRTTDHTFGIWYRIAANVKVQYTGRYDFFFFFRSLYSLQLIFLFIYWLFSNDLKPRCVSDFIIIYETVKSQRKEKQSKGKERHDSRTIFLLQYQLKQMLLNSYLE